MTIILINNTHGVLNHKCEQPSVKGNYVAFRNPFVPTDSLNPISY